MKLAAVSVVKLAVFLNARVLAAAPDGYGSMRLARPLDVSIVPLVMVFATIPTVKVLAVLSYPPKTVTLQGGSPLGQGARPPLSYLLSEKPPQPL